MPRSESRAAAPPGGMIRLSLLATLLCALSSGCINVGVMLGKVILGNPTQTSAFELQYGVSLEKEDHTVAVVCTAPPSAVSEFDGMELDVQDEVTRRMRMRDIEIASGREVGRAMNRTYGRFDENALAAALDDVDFIIHVDIEQFTHNEDGNPELYRCHCRGVIYAYKVTRDPEETDHTRIDRVFFQEINTIYPTTQPITADMMSKRVFHQKCVDHVADVIGRAFYDVETVELFN